MRERNRRNYRRTHTQQQTNEYNYIYIYMSLGKNQRTKHIYIYICMEITGVIIPMTIGIILLHHRKKTLKRCALHVRVKNI